MIGYIIGTIKHMNLDSLVVMTKSGVGYTIAVPSRYATRYTHDAAIQLHIYTHVREDTIELFGFESSDELSLFIDLLAVSGVGPRTALAVVNRGVSQVHEAVVSADVAFFTAVPRLGKKNAQKIIIEMKNKVGGTKDINLSGMDSAETQQVIDALKSMGFKQKEIQQSLQYIHPSDTTVEKKITRLLKHLGRYYENK